MKKVVRLHFTDEEYDRIQKYADRTGESVQHCVKRVMLDWTAVRGDTAIVHFSHTFGGPPSVSLTA